ncbi:MAG: DUF1499 domain-containing protein [Tabrizicola sp.]|uniref:DUF1499 domain-containing protein n=1 Tax=Tabrizicola sp. TaxID=2005166 RepID=UPI00273674A5|nr:DUF1499 domain-containing protein [Tabrizicola sp.]MDP3264458.1 DUF1499 domain-containing protein [Tabrizicola sp.]MDP3646504.1 DUF1499 domain-containing protein [Paracoccaceae bacterium]MDZ4066701.1 DUF1499 domain-containing protein [Tabrizicola sp.]
MFLWLAAAVLAGAAAYVRLAPVDPAVWNRIPAGIAAGPDGQVAAFRGGAALLLSPARGAPGDLLARLDAVARATPRTRVIAGSLDEGRITWETRSLIWGFPDYTTAEVQEDGLHVYARLRFGGDDTGVNARRLTDWLARL